jgi:YHS domain-containing protein
MRNTKVLALAMVIVLALAFSGFAQQTSDETVTCPVSGKVMKKSEAKVSYEYQGKTYYFCCEGCKEKFVKDPEKYLQKKEEAKGVYTCPMHPEVKADQPGKCPKCGMNLEKKAMPQEQGMMQHGQMGGCQKMKMGAEGQGCAMNCPLHSKDVEMKTENVTDGVVLKVTSKNPEMVKKIQEHFAKMKACREKAAAAPKQEEKK